MNWCQRRGEALLVVGCWVIWPSVCCLCLCPFECYVVLPDVIVLSPSVDLSVILSIQISLVCLHLSIWVLSILFSFSSSFFSFFFFLICVFKCYVDHPNFVSVCPFDCYAVYSDIIVMPLSSHLSALLSIQMPLFCLFSVLLSVILPVSQCVEGCVVMVLEDCLCHREDRTYQHKEKRRTSLTCLICMVKFIGISL